MVPTSIGCTKIQATTWMEELRKTVSGKRGGKIVCMPTQRYNASSGKVRKIFVGILSVELDGFRARKWNAERVIVFNLTSNAHKALTSPRKFESAYCFNSIAGIMERLARS